VNLAHTSTPVIAAATVVSICFAVVLVQAAGAFLPQRSANDADPRGSGLGNGVQPVLGEASVAEQR
jgi:hypothetical protein